MRARKSLLGLLLCGLAFGQAANPGRVNVVATPWGINWLTHVDDASGLTDLGFSAFIQSLIGDATAGDVLTDLGFSTLSGSLPALTTALDYKSALHLDHVVDVRDYGADPTGALDSTSALQTCIDLGPHTCVAFPPGTYKFSHLDIKDPVTLIGLAGPPNARWNQTTAGVTLLHDGTVSPAIEIGGTSTSANQSGGYGLAEGVRFERLLITPVAVDTDIGILIDGSTTRNAQRGPTMDISFVDVVVRDFGSYNVEYLGEVFDVRWHRGGQRALLADGHVGTHATGKNGDVTPGQISYYDFYSQANSAPGSEHWNLDGQFQIYGGGIAYGHGYKMQGYGKLFGTHLEGVVTQAGVGIQIAGLWTQAYTRIGGFSTGIKIGNGDATQTTQYFLDAVVTGCTVGVLVTSGGAREGTARLEFSSCTTNWQDDRATTNGVNRSVQLLNNSAATTTMPSSGQYLVGQRVDIRSASAGKALGWVCVAAGSPGALYATGTAPGAIGKSGDYVALATDTGCRFSNYGATGTSTISLPDSVVGMVFSFIRLSSQSFRVDPDASDTIRGASGAGKYLQLDANGDAVELMCVQVGIWDVVSKNCTPSYE